MTASTKMADKTKNNRIFDRKPLSDGELQDIDAYFRAANYVSVGQIYLLSNPLLKEPLKIQHVKPRLLGHWGTTPGLNLIYVHLNRLIKQRDLNVIYITGPGHGGPCLVANTYLEGTYSEFYPRIGQDEEGLQLLFKQFSFPGGIPSHVAPETPGSIHEGGELGYAPDLRALRRGHRREKEGRRTLPMDDFGLETQGQHVISPASYALRWHGKEQTRT